jgi:hypothetical protein
MFYAIDLAYRLVQAASAPAQVVDAWAPGDGKVGTRLQYHVARCQHGAAWGQFLHGAGITPASRTAH